MRSFNRSSDWRSFFGVGRASESAGWLRSLVVRQSDWANRTLSLHAGFIPAHYFLGQAYEHKAMYDEAIAEYRIAVDLSGASSLGRSILAKATARAGRIDEAERILHTLLELLNAGHEYVPAYGIALIYLGLDDTNRAIEWLSKAFDERFIWLVYLNVDPVFDALRGQPGFDRLIEQMQFPQPPDSLLG